MTAVTLINGQPETHASILDRGFAYGQGVFETIRVANSKPVLFPEHLQRLTLGCERLHIPLSSQLLESISSEAHQLAQEQNQCVLKIIITAGVGGRGYQAPEKITPARILARFEFTAPPISYYQQGIKMRTCDYRIPNNRALAGIKHLNRLDQVLARAEWHDPEVAEGIMLDENGCVIEGTKSNIFAVIDQTLTTPTLEYAGVRGVMRDRLMKFAVNEGIKVAERLLPVELLQQADEIFLCNSVFGVWPVTNWDNTSFEIGPVTRRCQRFCERLFNS